MDFLTRSKEGLLRMEEETQAAWLEGQAKC